MPDVCFNSWQAGGCEWSIGCFWGAMDSLGRADVILLALMLTISPLSLAIAFIATTELADNPLPSFEMPLLRCGKAASLT